MVLLAVSPAAFHLDTAGDQQAFRRWSTFLAEAQYFNPPGTRPPEITDCSSLIRYCFREALRKHDARWAAEAGLPLVPPFESVSKYNWPRTPAGAAMFLTGSGDWAEFADARTLRQFNAHRVSRNLEDAAPGDLLFFGKESAQHSMVYVGPSLIAPDKERYVVYHTGPHGGDPGEMRRLNTRELLRYPDPQWRPVPSNPHFLGVYRWNIL